jgi:cytoskeletal protein RodZ
VEAHGRAVDHLALRMRRARETADLTLEELSRRTKIPLRRLVALESADVPNLPAAVYTRGFVKAYAAEVGLPPEGIASEYLAAIAKAEGYAPLPTAPPAPVAPSRTREYGVGPRIVPDSSRLARLTTVGAAIGLLVYVGTINRLTGGQSSSDAADSMTATPAGVMTDSSLADARQTPMIVAAGATAADGPLDLQLLSQGPCWLMLTVDGERVLMRLVRPGERLSFAVTEEALLRVGDPGAMSLTINGQNVRALGPPGRPVNVTISKDKLKELLTS